MSLRAGVDVDGEVEEVAQREPPRDGGLQHVEALDDQDVGPPHDHLGPRHDVVARVRVEGRPHLFCAALDLRDEAQQVPAVVRLGEPLAVHDAAALELGVRVEEPVGGDQLDAGRVVPAAQQLAQEARDGRLADGHRARDADHERGALRPLAQEVAGGPVQVARTGGVEVEEAAERHVDVLHLAHVEPVAEAAELHDLASRSAGARRRGEVGPGVAVDLDERRLAWSASGRRRRRRMGARRPVAGRLHARDAAGRARASPTGQCRRPRIVCMCGIVGYVGSAGAGERSRCCWAA